MYEYRSWGWFCFLKLVIRSWKNFILISFCRLFPSGYVQSFVGTFWEEFISLRWFDHRKQHVKKFTMLNSCFVVYFLTVMSHLLLVHVVDDVFFPHWTSGSFTEHNTWNTSPCCILCVVYFLTVIPNLGRRWRWFRFLKTSDLFRGNNTWKLHHGVFFALSVFKPLFVVYFLHVMSIFCQF